MFAVKVIGVNNLMGNEQELTWNSDKVSLTSLSSLVEL